MSYQTANRPFCLVAAIQGSAGSRAAADVSALCALFCCSEASAFEAASTAGQLWKEISEEAGRHTNQNSGGIGQFHMSLMDMTEQKIFFSARL